MNPCGVRLALLVLLCARPASAGSEATARRLYEEGLEQYRRGDLAEAVSSMTKSLGEHKGLLLANGVRAQARRALGDWAGAEADNRLALGIGNPHNAETFTARGNARLLAGDPRGALQEFEGALRKDEEYADGYLGRGRALDAMGRRAAAMADWRKALALDPKLALARYSLASALHDEGKDAQAVEELTRTLRENARFPSPYSLLGAIFAGRGDLDRATKAYAKAILLAPSLAFPYIGRGLILISRGKGDPGTKDLETAVWLAPHDYAPYYNRGEVRYRQGDKPAGLADFRQALACRLDYPPAAMAMGGRFMENALWKEAEQMYGMAYAAAARFERQDWELEAALARARAIERLPDQEGALRELTLAVRISSTSARVWTDRARLLMRLRRPGKAEEDLKAALAIKPDYAPALAARGSLKASGGRFEEALRDFDAALKSDPKLGQAYDDRAMLFAGVFRDLGKAAEDMEKAVALEPGRADFFLDLGAVRLRRYDALRALEALDEALRLKADPARALELRAAAHFHLGNRTLAERDIAEARAAAPKSSSVLGAMGSFRVRQRDFDSAIKLLGEAIDLNKENGRAAVDRGLAYAGKGEFRYAESDFLRGAALSNRPGDALVLACQAQRVLGRPQSAVGTCSRAVAADAELPAAYVQRGLAYLALGEFSRAIRDLDDGTRLGLPLAPALLGRSLAHTANGQYKEADRAWREALAVDPRARYADIPFGEAQNPKWDYHARIEALEPALAKEPDNPYTYLVRGDSLHAGGYFDKAILEYTRAMELDGNLAAAYLDRGASLAAQDSMDAAEADMRRAVELDPTDTLAPVSLITLLTVRGKYADALKAAAGALMSHPKDPELYVKTGNLRYFLKDLRKARENFALALRLDSNSPSAHNGLGLCSFARRQYPAALESFSRAIALRPGYDRYYRNRASAYVNMGDFADAAADYQLALASNTDPEMAVEYRKLLQNSLARAGSKAAAR